MTQDKNLRVVKNDNFVVDFQFVDIDDNVIDLTGITDVEFNVADDYGLVDPALLSFSLGDGISVPDPTDGTIKVSTPQITLDARQYKYDLSTTINSVKITWLRGFFTVLPEVAP